MDVHELTECHRAEFDFGSSKNGLKDHRIPLKRAVSAGSVRKNCLGVMRKSRLEASWPGSDATSLSILRRFPIGRGLWPLLERIGHGIPESGLVSNFAPVPIF